MTDEPAVRTRRRRLPVLAGLAGLVVVALALLGWALGQRTDPRDLVVDYVDAIAAGDVERANELAADGVQTTGELPAAGSMDGAARVTAVQVGEDGRDTHVLPYAGPEFDAVGYEVSYEVGGQRVTDSVFVERTGGWWLRPEWRIRESLAQSARVSMEQPLRAVDLAIGSTTVAASAGQPGTVVPLYPGGYRVVPDPDGPVALDPQELAVTDESPFLLLEATAEQLRASTGDPLLAAAVDALDLCTDTSDDRLVCDGGAFAVADDADDAGARVTWRVEGDVAVDAEQAFAQTWRTAATVVATWTDLDGTVREQRFALDGQASVVSVTPDDVQVVASWTGVVDL